MFAFAIWDENKGRLLAARDHLGQKPFYYAHRGDELLFGSEIKAILAADPSLAEMDLSALDQYLALRIIAPPKSMFRGIRKLPPGHRLTFDRDGTLTVDRYWDLPFGPKLEGSDEELTEELERRMIETVRIHLVSDVEVGAFLSAGLDSTLVVSILAKHVTDEPFRTFSMGLDHGDYNEAPYAKLVAERYGTTHHERMIEPSLVKHLPALLRHLDEPSDPLSLCMYLLAKMVREHVKVVLGGDGGDELFGGYDRYYGNTYAGALARVPAFVRRHAIGPALGLIPDGNWYKSMGHQLKWLHELSFLSGGARYARSLNYFYFSDVARDALYGPAMRDAAAAFDPGKPIRDAFERAEAANPVDRMLYADSQIRLPDHPVMILDRMTMAHSLEARAPFMDHKLAEFSARLPSRLKVKGRKLRQIQVKLAERYLPEEVMARKKQGFSSPLPYMLAAEFKSLFSTYLADSHLARDGIFRPEPIQGLLATHLEGRADNGNRLWLLLNSELWYRMYIEGTSQEAMTEQLQGVTVESDISC